MSIVSPENTERFYLKLLLYKIKGTTSFKNLLTVNKTLVPGDRAPLGFEFRNFIL